MRSQVCQNCWGGWNSYHNSQYTAIKKDGGRQYGHSSVQSLSCVQLFATPWTAACQASLSITNSWSLLKLISIESVMPSNHLILCHPLLLPPSIFPSIRVFSNESALRWLRMDTREGPRVFKWLSPNWHDHNYFLFEYRLSIQYALSILRASPVAQMPIIRVWCH